jgi:hypothetical protein
LEGVVCCCRGAKGLLKAWMCLNHTAAKERGRNA